jgi:hypothetical protein
MKLKNILFVMCFALSSAIFLNHIEGKAIQNDLSYGSPNIEIKGDHTGDSTKEENLISPINWKAFMNFIY